MLHELISSPCNWLSYSAEVAFGLTTLVVRGVRRVKQHSTVDPVLD